MTSMRREDLRRALDDVLARITPSDLSNRDLTFLLSVLIPAAALADTSTFDDLVAGQSWDAKVPCQYHRPRGAQCQRKASWWVRNHGCGTGTICTQHLNLWVRQSEAVLAACTGDYGWHRPCGKRFNQVLGPSGGAFITAVRL